jgi:hypothetical protein
MPRRTARVCWPLVLLLTAGCGSPSLEKGADEEGQFREAFAAYQQALRARDADKLWDLLGADARAAADRTAGRLRDEFAFADAATRARLAASLGLSEDRAAAITGKEYLTTRRFAGTSPQDEIPNSKFAGVTIRAEKATVEYVEPDDDRMELHFVREGERWKISPAVD